MKLESSSFYRDCLPNVLENLHEIFVASYDIQRIGWNYMKTNILFLYTKEIRELFSRNVAKNFLIVVSLTIFFYEIKQKKQF